MTQYFAFLAFPPLYQSFVSVWPLAVQIFGGLDMFQKYNIFTIPIDALAPNTRRVGNNVQDQASLVETISLQPEQAEFTSPQPPLDIPTYVSSYVLERVPAEPSQPIIDHFEPKADEEVPIQPQPNPVQSDRWLPFERDEQDPQAQPVSIQTFQPQAPLNDLVSSTKQIVIQDQSIADKTNSIESVPAPVYSPLNALVPTQGYIY